MGSATKTTDQSGTEPAIELTSTQCEQQKQSSIWAGGAGIVSPGDAASMLVTDALCNGFSRSSAHKLG